MKGHDNESTGILMISLLILAVSLTIYGCSNKEYNTNVTDNSTLVTIIYTPMQCDTTPWDAWLANSSIRFIRAPTEQQIISMFYGQEYNITLRDIQIIKTSDIICEACSVCSKGYNIEADVESKDLQVMLDTGWKKSS